MQHYILFFCLSTLGATAASQIVSWLTSQSDVTVLALLPWLWLEYIALSSIRKIWFHPLAKYPGPALAALSEWYTMFHLVKGDRHLDFYRTHQKYGKFVRYAPNRLSVKSITAMNDIYGVQANTQKSSVYGTFKHFFSGTEMSMTEIDRAKHGAKRRVNASALTTEALKRAEPAMISNIEYFLAEASKTSGSAEGSWSQAQNISKIAGYLTSDMMGDVTFSKNWNVQRDPAQRQFVDDSALGTAGIHLTGHLPRLFTFNMHRLLFKPLIDGVHRLAKVSDAITQWRIAQGDTLDRDLFAALMYATDPETGRSYTREELVSEAGLLIVAGTDTTTTAISATIFYLLHNPDCLNRLRKELDSTLESTDPTAGWSRLETCRYLTACVEESLRMSPPVGSILPREVLPGGIAVDGMLLPAGIDVGVPHYAIQHDEEFYPNSFSFQPDRWLVGGPLGNSDEDIRRARDALLTFGYGRTSCIGKRLAFKELHLLIGRLVAEYDMRIAPGTTDGEGGPGKGFGRERKGEFQLKDRFVAMQQGPMVEFRKRTIS